MNRKTILDSEQNSKQKEKSEDEKRLDGKEKHCKNQGQKEQEKEPKKYSFETLKSRTSLQLLPG